MGLNPTQILGLWFFYRAWESTELSAYTRWCLRVKPKFTKKCILSILIETLSRYHHSKRDIHTVLSCLCFVHVFSFVTSLCALNYFSLFFTLFFLKDTHMYRYTHSGGLHPTSLPLEDLLNLIIKVFFSCNVIICHFKWLRGNKLNYELELWTWCYQNPPFRYLTRRLVSMLPCIPLIVFFLLKVALPVPSVMSSSDRILSIIISMPLLSLVWRPDIERPRFNDFLERCRSHLLLEVAEDSVRPEGKKQFHF